MPDQTIAFTPYRLDLTGLRAGQLVSHAGVLYDVDRVEVQEKLGGRNVKTGAAEMIETQVEIKLVRARWVHDPWIDAPTEFLVLPELDPGLRKTVINGQAYWVCKLDLTTVTPVRSALDLAAKRQIIDIYEAGSGFTGQILRNCLDTPIRLLALPYAGHPEFREEWKP